MPPLLLISPSCFGFEDLGKCWAKHTGFIRSGLGPRSAYPAEVSLVTAVKMRVYTEISHLFGALVCLRCFFFPRVVVVTARPTGGRYEAWEREVSSVFT